MTEALELLIGLQAVSGAKAKHDFLLQHKDEILAAPAEDAAQ